MSSDTGFADGGVGADAIRRGRIGLTAIFVIFGVIIGTWAAHIPVVQARLDINPAMLGIVLLASAAGTILAQPALGILIGRIGSRRPAVVFAPISIIVMTAAILSPSLPLLFIASFFVGICLGGFNVAMNTQASLIETLRGKPTMSSFHAGASVGMLAGAAIASALFSIGWNHGEGALAVAGVQLVAAAFALPHLVRDKPQDRGPAFVLPNRAVFGLGVLAFLMFVVEGGMVDWSALFLAHDKSASPVWAAAGFAMFTGAMVLFRVVGNTVVARLGPWPTVTVGGLLVALGIIGAILSPSAPVAALSFALAGIGAANIIPILISTAAQTPGISPGVSIGAVATMMTMGFLVGPPLIGFVSNSYSLSLGISLMALAGLIVAGAGALQVSRSIAR